MSSSRTKSEGRASSGLPADPGDAARQMTEAACAFRLPPHAMIAIVGASRESSRGVGAKSQHRCRYILTAVGEVLRSSPPRFRETIAGVRKAGDPDAIIQ